MKRYSFLIKTIVAVVIFLSVSLSVCAKTDDKTDTVQRKKVRVGYFIGEGFQEISPLDGHRSGYCYEYLQTLADYTNWQYEYVETSWAGALKMIKSGEIDILAQVSKTKERQQYMLYTDHPMGAEDYYLYVLPNKDKKLRSDDISTLNGAKVGVNAGSYQLLAFKKWCRENNVRCKIVESEDEDYRLDCFKKGKLDAIVDNDYYLDYGWIPLYKTGTSDYYMCVTPSRKDIYEELNAAQEKLFENSPMLIQKLQSKYFPHDTTSTTLNNYEKKWLEERKKAGNSIKLGYVDDFLPYCSQNKDTEQLEGTITVFIQNLKENYDIEMESIPYQSLKELYEAIHKKEIDACFPLYNMLWQSEELGIMQTDAFVDFPMAYIFRKGEYDKSQDKKTFAVAKSYQMQSAYIKDKHPGAKIVYYDNINDCMKAVSDGDVDGMYINSFVLSRYYDMYQSYSNLDTFYSTQDSSFCLGVSTAASPELLTIFNKNISRIDKSVITSNLVRNTQIDPKDSIAIFIKTHAFIIILSILVFSALLVAFFYYQFRRVRLAQKHEREARIAVHQAFEAANKANNAKTEFLSSMSHDIRTPMNAIVGMTAIATANMDDTEKVRHCLSRITTSSKHLLRLINEVLDMNKIESGNLSLTESEFNLIKMIDDFISVIKPLVEEKEHSLNINVNEIAHKNVVGDAERIHQCLVNFMSNAVKYTPKGGKIQLSVTEKETNLHQIGCYEFIIEDNGIGMSEDFVKVMFEPFTRADDRHVAKQQGTGLGMSITRNVIKMMDGDIKVESKVNEGTKIITTIYLAFREANDEPEVSTIDDITNSMQKFREKDCSGVNILLVEDNEINAEIATEILKMTGMNIEHVWNGQEAVEKLSEVSDDYYKLVFMDVQMPVMDGFEATMTIRATAREYLQKIPIIAMTANAFAEDVEKAKSVGMNGHIAKPPDLGRLLRVLQEYVMD